MKGDYPYPPDEFDVAAAGAVPQGVHRAPRSRGRRLLPFLVLLVVAPVLAYGVVTWTFAHRGTQAEQPTVAEEPSEVAEDPETQEPPADETPAEPTESAPPVEETPEPPPPPPVDPGTPVEIFNATNTSGLAGGAADLVEDAGFAEVSTGNWRGDDLETSVVLYASPEDVTTAQAVADALGLSRVEQSDVEGVVVVLYSDYTP